MGIERTEVRFETTGEQQAQADVRAIEREMQRLEQRAKSAEDAVRRAKAGGQAKYFAGDGAAGLRHLGLGRSGFSFNSLARAHLGGGMGPLMGGAIAAGVAYRGTPALAEGAADLVDFLRENPSPGEMAKAAAVAFWNKAKAAPQQAITRTAAALFRLTTRASKETAESAREAVLDPDAAVAREIEDFWANKRVRLQREAAEALAAIRLEAQRAAALERLSRDTEEAVTKQLAGLSNETLPVGLNRATAQRYRALREEQVRQGAKLRQQQGREKIMLAGEGD